MRKIIIISIFILGMIITGLNAKAVDVSNEQQLRAAIEQGGDITLTQNIEVTQPLVINKDVNISGSDYYSKSILMQGDNTLMTINSGNVTLAVDLYAGWNGGYDKYDNPTLTENQGKAIVVNNGNIKLSSSSLEAENVGLEVNDGIVTGSLSISAGEKNNYSYSGGEALVANGGTVNLNYLQLHSGGTAITLNNNAKVYIISDMNIEEITIDSDEGNGIEVNDDASLTLKNVIIYSEQNSIYLNGGTTTLSGQIDISRSNTRPNGNSIYFNEGVNPKTKNDILVLKEDFKPSREDFDQLTPQKFSIYVNPEILELKIIDEAGMVTLNGNKLKMSFCDYTWSSSSQSENDENVIYSDLLGKSKDGLTKASKLYSCTPDREIESNELGKCTTVYINGVKQNEADASCTPVSDEENQETQNPQVVEVPSTSAYGSIIIAALGIICVIVSVFVTRKMIKQEN